MEGKRCFKKRQMMFLKEQKAVKKEQKAALKRPKGYEKKIETKETTCLTLKNVE